jgi:hypothetical protein
MEVTCSFEILVDFTQATYHYILEDNIIQVEELLGRVDGTHIPNQVIIYKEYCKEIWEDRGRDGENHN